MGITYKGTNFDMTCRGYQYEINKTYHLDDNEKPEVGRSGFHSCFNPLDTFNIYSPYRSRYFEVESTGEIDENHRTSTIASSEITFVSELSSADIFNKAYKPYNVLNLQNKIAITMENNKAAGVGDDLLEYDVAAIAAGYGSIARSDFIALTLQPESIALITPLYNNFDAKPVALTMAPYSKAEGQGIAICAGDSSTATTQGQHSVAIGLQNFDIASVECKNSIAAGLGYKNVVKSGDIGSAIVLTEWKHGINDRGQLTSVKAAMVDGEAVKANTFYMLENGELIEVSDPRVQK